MVLIVDLFPAPPDPTSKQDAKPKIDAKRVNVNNSEWSQTSLSGLITPIAKDLKYICLVINKVDLIRPYEKNGDIDVVKAYCSLWEKLLNFSSGREVQIWLGSLSKGTCYEYHQAGIPESKRRTIFEALAEHAEDYPGPGPMSCREQFFEDIGKITTAFRINVLRR